jgi:hypothetical protein
MRWIWQGVVRLIASGVAAVLSDERVQTAAAGTMVRAMNEFLCQPNLNDHVRTMSESLAKNQEDYARSAGQDFPKLAGQFIQGLLSPKQQQQQQQQQPQRPLDKEKGPGHFIQGLLSPKRGPPEKGERGNNGEGAVWAATATAASTTLAHGTMVEAESHTTTATSPAHVQQQLLPSGLTPTVTNGTPPAVSSNSSSSGTGFLLIPPLGGGGGSSLEQPQGGLRKRLGTWNPQTCHDPATTTQKS